MISIDNHGNLIVAVVLGEFTLADYQEFEELADYKIKFGCTLDLLFDLREMAGFTVDLAVEEIRHTLRHARDFHRIAILTDDQWVTWSAWVTQFFVDAEIQVFDNEPNARLWLETGQQAFA
ncbi:MAG: STAS/SEC14 domain-containing protein [Betaproteobacteria bacterium]|nr:STAS/SEC14 domain-containing protein [Betaproteobacteria bacterium]